MRFTILRSPTPRRPGCAPRRETPRGVPQAASGHGLDVLARRDVAAQLLLDAVDDSHDRARAAAADAVETQAGDPVADVQHLDDRAVHLQGRPDLPGPGARDAVFQALGLWGGRHGT